MTTNKERWNNWALVTAGGRTYLGKIINMESDWDEGAPWNNIVMRPCIQIIEQYPVIPGPNNQPVLMPVASFATIGMFGTDDVQVAIHAETCVNLDNATEEQLAAYTDAYDKMLEQAKINREAKRLREAAIKPPSGDDINRFGKGGGGGQANH